MRRKPVRPRFAARRPIQPLRFPAAVPPGFPLPLSLGQALLRQVFPLPRLLPVRLAQAFLPALFLQVFPPALFPQAAVPATKTTVSVPASSFFTILLFIVLSSFQSFTLRIHQKNLVMRILRQRSKSLRLGCSVFLFLSSGDKAFSFRLKSKARPNDQRIECHEDGRQHDKDREHGDQRSAGHHNAQ